MSEAPPMILSQVIFYVVLFVVLLSLVGGGFVLWYKDQYAGKGCLLSIAIRDQTNEGDLECDRKVFEIDVKNENYINKLASKYRTEDIPKAVTMNYVADAMVDCWKQMGEGKYNVFRNEFVLDKQVHCFVCNTFKMPSDMDIGAGTLELLKTIDTEDNQLINFKEFLHTDFGPKEGSSKRYSDLLRGGLFSNPTGEESDEYPFLSSMDYLEAKDKPFSSTIHNYLGLIQEVFRPYQTSTLVKGELYATVYWSVAQEAFKKGFPGSVLNSIVGVQKDPGFVFVVKYSDLGNQGSTDYGDKNKFSCEVLYA